MKLVFLNVWGGEIQDELFEFIKNEARDTDIFCFQEATDEMKRHCKPILTDYKEISDYKFIGNDDDFPQAMFIKNDIEVISTGTLLAQDTDCGLAIYAEVKVGNAKLCVCNVHGLARPNDKLDSPGRLKLSKQLIEFFEGKDEPVVIGGDFNLELNTESVKSFEEHGYRNLIKEFNIDTTRNHLAWDRYPDNKQYFSDYVFLNSKVRCKSFKVLDNEVSDHLPLILEI